MPRIVPNRHSGMPAIGDEESRPQTPSSVTNEWNDSHPCFPHRNPYVPTNSPLYESTRIIRIQRDFMISGDLSPAYSNTFPDILEPYVSEERFRMVIAHVNKELDKAFDPWNLWNWLDAMSGLLTLWVLEDIIDTYIKRKLRAVEAFLQQQNEELEKAGSQAVFVPLRRTGYMNLDIQIPNPIPLPDEGDQLPPDPDDKFNIAPSDAGSAVPTIEINEYIGSPTQPGTHPQYTTADHYPGR
ncbi:Golgin subfamily A member 7/ERF4 family-domain-containing protein [Tuber borchii]|uniref:Ras modification protein ERF4 n=1 Tax=Tuber borchii TaxID=42251 RepID=A0A2T6ZIZ0_TUBBO|nr:Golgin subfamily A member 7/ERF4 family-domain-containing protein [Tuber borchii]